MMHAARVDMKLRLYGRYLSCHAGVWQ